MSVYAYNTGPDKRGFTTLKNVRMASRTHPGITYGSSQECANQCNSYGASCAGVDWDWSTNKCFLMDKATSCRNKLPNDDTTCHYQKVDACSKHNGFFVFVFV